MDLVSDFDSDFESDSDSDFDSSADSDFAPPPLFVDAFFA